MDSKEPLNPPPTYSSSYGATNHQEISIRDRHNQHTLTTSNDNDRDYIIDEHHLQHPHNDYSKDQDQRHLLRSPQHTVKHHDKQEHSGRSGFCGGRVCIEIPVFLYFVSVNNTGPLVQFYLTDRLYEELGVPNVTGGCYEGGGGSGSGSESALENEIQSRVSTYTIFISLMNFLPSALPILFLGSLSRRFGHKAALYVVVLGTATRMAVYTLVFHYDWQIEYLYIGSAVEGVTGSFGCFLMASYAIVADVTVEGGKSRSLKIVLVEAVTMVGSSAGTTMAGYWLRAFGFVVPMLFSIGLQVSALLFLIFFVRETATSPRETAPITCSVWLRSGQVFFRKPTTQQGKRSRRSFLLTCIFTFSLGIFTLVANKLIILLYLINAPFCWSETHFSVYGGVYMLSSWIAVLTLTSCVAHRVADDTLAMVGALSGMAGLIFQGLSESDLFIYVGAGVALLSNMAWPMLRTLMSKAVDAEEQSPLFAGIAVTEMLTTTAAGIVSPAIYKASLGHVHGLPFFCYAGIDAVMAFCVISLIVRRKMQDPQVDESSERILK